MFAYGWLVVRCTLGAYDPRHAARRTAAYMSALGVPTSVPVINVLIIVRTIVNWMY